jgi:tetratricopeptide (TPR) repeat protein
MSADLEIDEIGITAYQWLGYNQLQAGQYQESIKYYMDVVNFSVPLRDDKKKLNAYLGLGSAYNSIGA